MEENEFNFFPFWGRIFSLCGTQKVKIFSLKVKIFSHKRSVFTHTILYFFVLRQRENIIRLADNIYPSTDSMLNLTELYNYPPLIGHEFPHKRSPIEGIPCRLHLTDATVGSLKVKILIFFLCNSVKLNHMSHLRSTFNGWNFLKRELWIPCTDIFLPLIEVH